MELTLQLLLRHQRATQQATTVQKWIRALRLIHSRLQIEIRERKVVFQFEPQQPRDINLNLLNFLVLAKANSVPSIVSLIGKQTLINICPIVLYQKYNIIFPEYLICLFRFDGCVYAVKKTRKPIKGSQDENSAIKEVCAHAVLGKHKNVVRYYSAWCENDRMLIQSGNTLIFIQTSWLI